MAHLLDVVLETMSGDGLPPSREIGYGEQLVLRITRAPAKAGVQRRDCSAIAPQPVTSSL